MQLKLIVREAEEGGFWAEVPAIPGCASQGETREELMRNIQEAMEGCLAVEVDSPQPTGRDEVVEFTVLCPVRNSQDCWSETAGA